MPIQTTYTLKFSDPNKTEEIVVPGSPNGSGKNNYDTSLDLVGPGYVSYGQSIAQNFVKLVENFAGPNPPQHAIEGQLWYDTSDPGRKVLRVNNGELSSARWPSANGIYQQSENPATQYLQNVKEGDIWVDTAINQLKIRFGEEWTVVGPSTTTTQNKTGSEVVFLETTSGGQLLPVIKNWVDGKVVEIISYYDFTPKIVIDGFSSLRAGANLTNKVASKFNGLADRANSLEVTRGVVIKATEVLKNKIPTNARQTHTGTFVIESGNGLIVKRNSSYPEVRIIGDKNTAYVTFTGTNAYMRVGLEDDSYISFNNTNNAVGINTPPTVLSSASTVLNVAGGASFTGKVIITTSSVNSNMLEVAGSSYISNNLTVGGGASIIGKTTVSNTLTVVDIYASTSTATIGTVDIPFDRIFVKNIGRVDGPLVNIYGNVTTATYLASSREFSIKGVVVSNTSTFNGTQNIVFTATAHRTLISDLAPATSANSSTYNLMVLDTSTGATSLARISKSDFLSDVYSNVVHTGMINLYSGLVPPDGWRWCDGAVYSPSNPVYTKLFSVIGYTYGNNAGDFIVPNMTATTFVNTSPGTGTYIQYIIKI